MKKQHTYEVRYYTSGGWLKSMFVEAYDTNDAIKKVRSKEVIIEIYGVRKVWYNK